MKDIVRVSNLVLQGYHGVLPEETALGQKFHIDIECHVDTRPAAEQDDYDKAVCYATLCQIAAQVSDAGPYKLVETLAEKIAEAALARFEVVNRITVTVRKPAAPIPLIFDHVGVEVTRYRWQRFACALGSNVGHSASNIDAALAFLQAEDAIEIDAASSHYKTPPWGNEDQPPFINACAIGQTTLNPHEMLKVFKRIEIQLGRTPGDRWGPRVIDLDLLYQGDHACVTPGLTLPHPELFNRGFVLVPLAEIAGDQTVSQRSIADALNSVEIEGIEKLD